MAHGNSENKISMPGETISSGRKPTGLGIAVGYGWKKRGCLRDPEFPTWWQLLLLIAMLGLSAFVIFA